MYNGIGLQTVRGSGTNGYVQNNLSFVKNTRDKVKYRDEDELKRLDAQVNREPNVEILDHQRKRQIELKCAEYEELLQAQELSPGSVERRVDTYRQKLADKLPRVDRDEQGRPLAAGSHQMAEAQQEKNARLKDAFGISEHFVEGSSFDPNRRAKEEEARKEKEAQQKVYAPVRSPSASPSPSKKKHKKDKSEKADKKAKKAKKSKDDKEKSKSHKKKKSKDKKKSKKKRDKSPESSDSEGSADSEDEEEPRSADKAVRNGGGDRRESSPPPSKNQRGRSSSPAHARHDSSDSEASPARQKSPPPMKESPTKTEARRRPSTPDGKGRSASRSPARRDGGRSASPPRSGKKKNGAPRTPSSGSESPETLRQAILARMAKKSARPRSPSDSD